MTLHEAILSVVQKNGEPMKPRDIANQINQYGLYQSKTGKLVTPNQVWARVNKYVNQFKITSDKLIGELFNEVAAQDQLIEEVKKFIRLSNYKDIDLVLSFIIFSYHKVGAQGIFKEIFSKDFSSSLGYKKLLHHLVENSKNIYGHHDLFQLIESALNKGGEDQYYWLEHFFTLYDDLLSNSTASGLSLIYKSIIVQVFSFKSESAGFSTPGSLSFFMAGLADIKEGDTIYDPFAGVSVLLGTVVEKKKGLSILANDINAKAGIIGLMNLIISGANDISYTISDAFNHNHTKRYKWIISNPPFIRVNTNFWDRNEPSSSPIELVYNLLERGGKAIVAVQDAILHSNEKYYRYFREMLLKRNHLKAVISLPHNIFLPYTSVDTSILIIDTSKEHEEVFFAELDGLSIEEFEFKAEILSKEFRRTQTREGLSVLVKASHILEDKSLNLLPRKLLLAPTLECSPHEELKTLESIIRKRVLGKLIPSTNLNEDKDGVPYIRTSDLPHVNATSILSEAPKKFVSDIELVNTGGRLVTQGHIIISRYGPGLKATLYAYTEDALLSHNLFSFQVDEKLDPFLIVKELNSSFVAQQLRAIQVRGVGPVYYKLSDILQLKLRISSKMEQALDFLSSLNESLIFYTPKNSNYEKRGKPQAIHSFASLLLGDIDHIKPARLKKSDSTAIKEVREKEIIASIKHRIAQFLSPISNDLESLRMYHERKARENTPVSTGDKISSRETAATIAEVFNRINKNLTGVGQTFDLMNNILYFDKSESQFHPEDLFDLVQESYVSIKEKPAEITFVCTKESYLDEGDLKVPIDREQITELLRNFYFNSFKHGFTGAHTERKVISIFFSKESEGSFLELNLINNGVPFPEGFTLEDFVSFGTKGTNSSGTGIGGYLMKKIVDNHDGKLEWLGDEKLKFSVEDHNGETIISTASIHFKISLPYIHN